MRRRAPSTTGQASRKPGGGRDTTPARTGRGGTPCYWLSTCPDGFPKRASPPILGRMDRIEKLCAERGMRMTEQRRVIARVLSSAEDHPDVEELYRRASAIDPHISIATVYRTVRLFEDAGILERHDFRDGRARYEEMPESHHDHLIDVQSGSVIEFRNEEIEKLQRRVAEELGFELVDHRLELYGVPKASRKPS